MQKFEKNPNFFVFYYFIFYISVFLSHFFPYHSLVQIFSMFLIAQIFPSNSSNDIELIKFSLNFLRTNFPFNIGLVGFILT